MWTRVNYNENRVLVGYIEIEGESYESKKNEVCHMSIKEFRKLLSL